MQQFSEIITVDCRELFFVFSRLKIPGEDKFFVMVTKDAVTYSVHLMKSNLGKWEIVTPSAPGRAGINTFLEEIHGLID